MKYLMTVTLEDPKTEETILMKLKAEFDHDPKQYGNGHYMNIKSEDKTFRQSFDIRYDKNFKRDRKIGYLEQWVRNFWDGENGAYRVKRLGIEETED